METRLQEEQKMWHGTLKSYVIGFTVSLLLTSLAFLLVVNQMLAHHFLIYVISGLALLQAVVQLVYFLHVGQEGKPHWETFTFLFMLLILLIIVCGSLWIMSDLNARTMPQQMESMHD